MQTCSIKHNMEMGHRLCLQPDSKCFHLHGHSWWVKIEIGGPPDPTTGMIVNYSDMKAKLRPWLDKYFDHHFLLNSDDPLVQLIGQQDDPFKLLTEWGITPLDEVASHDSWAGRDPTVENVAILIYQKCKVFWPETYWRFRVEVQESHTNQAVYGDF